MKRPRIVASRSGWTALREAKRGPCRVCGKRWERCSLHHLVGRDLLGDDVPENLVPLCGDGTRGCHGLVEHHDRAACVTLRSRLRVEEIAYVLERKSEVFLDRYYPSA